MVTAGDVAFALEFDIVMDLLPELELATKLPADLVICTLIDLLGFVLYFDYI